VRSLALFLQVLYDAEHAIIKLSNQHSIWQDACSGLLNDRRNGAEIDPKIHLQQ